MASSGRQTGFLTFSLQSHQEQEKNSISRAQRREPSKWIIHLTCMELNEHAHMSSEEVSFYRPVTFSKQFCVCSLTSHVIGQSVLEKYAIYLMLVMECTCQWGCIVLVHRPITNKLSCVE